MRGVPDGLAAMVAMKAWLGILQVFIVAPIWYYLLYKVLVGVNATELMWFLFWVYVPLGMFIQMSMKILDAKE